MLSLSEFRKKAEAGGRLPLVAEVPNDLATPLAIYRRFADEKYSFLLESVEGGEKWARYSFIGLYPSVVFASRGGAVSLTREGKKQTVLSASDPFPSLRDILNEYRLIDAQGLDRFPGGAVGLVSYEAVRFFDKFPDLGKPETSTPDLYFVVPQILLIADALRQKLSIVYDARFDKKSDAAREYRKGKRLIEKVVRILNAPSEEPRKGSRKSSLPSGKLRWKASLSRELHAKGVEKIKEYIAAGDIFQAVFSIKFESACRVDAFSLYRTLRRINPSPYLFCLKYDGMSLVGASPETMVRVEGGEMILRPIAGTRPRGKDEAEDRALERELLEDAKEKAEHIMLVDLGRNDLGRVAQAGTVRVDELSKVERYSHVMHIVSNVRARLAPGKDAFDVLRATFPAGTLSGAPKIRAMEIIEEAEPVRRGFYGGCAGYFSFSGNMDMAITIRSALVEKDRVTVQAGGGIVADSTPEREYQEIVNKSKAVMTAIEMSLGNGKGRFTCS